MSVLLDRDWVEAHRRNHDDGYRGYIDEGAEVHDLGTPLELLSGSGVLYVSVRLSIGFRSQLSYE